MKVLDAIIIIITIGIISIPIISIGIKTILSYNLLHITNVNHYQCNMMIISCIVLMTLAVICLVINATSRFKQ